LQPQAEFGVTEESGRLDTVRTFSGRNRNI
jgi:hypothetical protein